MAARTGPRKIQRYTAEFKLKSVKAEFRWRRAFALALLMVAGPVVGSEYLTAGALTIEIIAPRLRVSGELAATILFVATLVSTSIVAWVLRTFFRRGRILSVG